MILIGGKEVKMLFNHVGNITEADNWPRILVKISNGIRGQTNQATMRFKLMQRMPQDKEYFAEWYAHIRDQVRRCTWTGYNVDAATRDVILLQMRQQTPAEDTVRRPQLCRHNKIRFRTGARKKEGR